MKSAVIKKLFAVFLVALALMLLMCIPLWRYDLFFKRAVKETRERYALQLVKLFTFSQESALKEWEEKIFKGKVVYRIEQDKSLSFVRATSNKTASALYYKIRLDAKKKHPLISWKWNVEKFPLKKDPESLETQNEDDFAARVYVIFPALFFTNSKVLEYIWAETLPAGLTGTSPYSPNIKLIVVRSGANNERAWYAEERDIVADYVRVFGRKPEYDIGAVAFMTNAEHTGTRADALYDEIKLGYKEEPGNKGGALFEDYLSKNKVSHE